MAYHAQLRCTQGCDVTLNVTSTVYRCPQCAGLLEVQHNISALRERSASEWKALFDNRRRESLGPYSSGVWSKREWVMPQMPDEDIISMGEGNTHLLHAQRYGKELGLDNVWVKMCGNSHTGSFKDLGMTVLVSVARLALQQGSPARALACASTGDTSAALAAYGAAAGLPVVVLLPRGKVSTAQLVQPLANGALVLALDTDFDGCMTVVQQLASEGLIYLANSMNALRLEGQKTVALEIVQQFGWQVPDWVVLPGGNLGNAGALYMGFRMLLETGIIDRYPRLCIAQSAAANPLYRSWSQGLKQLDPIRASTTLATAIQIGNPVSFPRAVQALRAMEGLVEQATEEQLAEAAAHADRTGFYACPHTGVALAAVEQLAARGEIRKQDRVVVVSTASGLKFTEFKVGYHEKTLSGVSSKSANQPVLMPAVYEPIKEAITRFVPERTLVLTEPRTRLVLVRHRSAGFARGNCLMRLLCWYPCP